MTDQAKLVEELRGYATAHKVGSIRIDMDDVRCILDLLASKDGDIAVLNSALVSADNRGDAIYRQLLSAEFLLAVIAACAERSQRVGNLIVSRADLVELMDGKDAAESLAQSQAEEIGRLRGAAEYMLSALKLGCEPDGSAIDKLKAALAAEAQVSALQAEVDHWKANHADVSRKKKEHERISKERYDALQAEVGRLERGVRRLASEEKMHTHVPMGMSPMAEEFVERIVFAKLLLSQPPADEPAKEGPLQPRVLPWMLETFGPEIPFDRQERGDRLLEEVLELLQSGGYGPARVASLRDYVWGRPVGKPHQEVGGVMITLAAYCIAHGLDMHQAGEDELARIWTKVEQIRAKQAAKPTGSALPVAADEPAKGEG